MDIDINSMFYKQEGKFLEYKQSYEAEDLASTAAAFATASGGDILIGVNNQGMPVGFQIDSEDKFRNAVYSHLKNITGGRVMMEIDFFPHDKDKKIILIHIHEGYTKPYGWKGVFYKRVDSSDEKLDADEVMKLRLESNNMTFDALPGKIRNRQTNPSDINEIVLKSYLEKISQNRRQRVISFTDAQSCLKNLDLINEQAFVKNAAILFLGKSPQSVFPSAKINFLGYSGNVITDSDLKFRKILDGNLIDQIDQVYSLIVANTENKIVMEGLKRIELNQYPSNALREAIINAIAHRDYLDNSSDILVRLFDNRLEIINPGGLMKGVKVEELKRGGHHSVKRNPIICRLLDHLGYMEQSGQGIQNMIESMKKFGLQEPNITVNDSSFKIEFIGQKISPENQSEKVLGASSTNLEPFLTDKEKEFINQIQSEKNKSITISEYLKFTRIKSRITAKKHLDKFVSFGLFKVKNRGSGKEIIYLRQTIENKPI